MANGWSAGDPARVLITGCSSGIGRALCAALSARGHHVIATARKLGALADVVADTRLGLDVTDADSVAAATKAAGPVDVLVNNAGFTAWAPLEMMPIGTAQRVFDTNVWGSLRMSQALLPAMRAKGRGRIINVGSAAVRGYPLLGLYAATKTALEVLTASMRLEVAGFGIDVLIAQPAAVVTSFGNNREPVDIDEPSYRDLTERALRYIQGMRGEVLTAEQAAAAIADLVELDDPPLGAPIGDDAKRRIEQRQLVSDEEFERSVLSAL